MHEELLYEGESSSQMGLQRGSAQGAVLIDLYNELVANQPKHVSHMISRNRTVV